MNKLTLTAINDILTAAAGVIDPSFMADALRMATLAVLPATVGMTTNTRTQDGYDARQEGWITLKDMGGIAFLGEYTIEVNNLKGVLAFHGTPVARAAFTGGVVTLEAVTSQEAQAALARMSAAILLGGTYEPASTIPVGSSVVETGTYTDAAGDTVPYCLTVTEQDIKVAHQIGERYVIHGTAHFDGQTVQF